MTWKLIEGIRAKADMRLIMPFGLGVRLGDVVEIGRDGGLSLQGTSRSLLRISPGDARPAAGGSTEMLLQSGKETQYVFKAAGEASTLFPDLPKAHAGFDISLVTADSWLLAAVGRRLDSLDELNRYRRPILDAYAAGVWKADWALVVAIGRVDRLTLLAASSASTHVALSLGADVAPDASTELRMTAGASLMAANQQLTKYIVDEPTIAFCRLLRVRDRWWTDPTVAVLDSRRPEGDALLVDDADFWDIADANS